MTNEQQKIADGTLVVRTAQDGEASTIALCGELDLANASTAEAALDAALADSAEVVVDMRELEFIDSTGIALLVSALGKESDETRIGFIPSASPAVTRVLELTGLAERLPLANVDA